MCVNLFAQDFLLFCWFLCECESICDVRSPVIFSIWMLCFCWFFISLFSCHFLLSFILCIQILILSNDLLWFTIAITIKSAKFNLILIIIYLAHGFINLVPLPFLLSFIVHFGLNLFYHLISLSMHIFSSLRFLEWFLK